MVKIGVQSLNYKRDGGKTNVLLNSKIVDKFLTFFFSDLYMREKVDGNNAGSKFNLLLYTGLER